MRLSQTRGDSEIKGRIRIWSRNRVDLIPNRVCDSDFEFTRFESVTKIKYKLNSLQTRVGDLIKLIQSMRIKQGIDLLDFFKIT